MIKESVFSRFLQSFFIAKAKGKEDVLLSKLEKEHPEVGKAWQKLNNTMDSNIKQQYNWMKSRGYDVSNMEDYMKKYGIEF